MIDKVKVDVEKLHKEALIRGMNWAALAKGVGKSHSYFSTIFCKENALPTNVVELIVLKFGIPRESFVIDEPVDDIPESISDALVNALVSEEFQRALFKAIYGAINLVELKKSERGITNDTV